MYVGLPGSSSDVSDEYVAMKSKYLGIVQMCATRQESRGVVREAVGVAPSRPGRSVERVGTGGGSSSAAMAKGESWESGLSSPQR